jgi:hypothetical protein
MLEKKQERWIRPVQKDNEEGLIRKLGRVDWDIPGHRQISDASQAKDIIEWSQKLGLIDEKRNTWTSFGSVLNRIIEQEQKNAFIGSIEIPNPLRLTLKQKIFFFYLMLYREGDFLSRFLRNFPHTSFSASDVTKFFYDSFHEIAQLLLSSKDYELIKEGESLSRSTKELKRNSAYMRSISKLENLTDLGILTRLDERKYWYIPDQIKLDMLNQMSSKVLSLDPKSSEEEWKNFFKSGFFSFAAEIFAIQLARETAEQSVAANVLSAYSKLAGGLGLCRIDEICLLAGINGLTEAPKGIIENGTAWNFLYKMNKQYGKLASFHVDMLGNIAYVKIDKSLLKEFEL